MKRMLVAALFLLAATVAKAQQVQHIQQALLDIPSGEYSGITRIQDDTYAVVHDKASGGGIFIFTIVFNADGTILSVNSFETDAKGAAGRDNEDVVYVPETKTLFVAAEGDQSIREYRLDGRETGRKLSIPKDLTNPQANAGFEALAYGNNTFWTTTEAPLPTESKAGLHQVQSFNRKTLKAKNRYTYQADSPLTGADDAARATAYAHGISAMTVLPDGRLAVLEREVYVPGSHEGFFSRILGSYTHSCIYVVDPSKSKAGATLPKTLLTSFYASALNLANFEGMCLGPKLKDGRQTLLLIADSQDSYGGLTGEYLRVIALDYNNK